MSLSRDQVEHIATLARVGVSEEEIERFGEQLSVILEYFERLRAVDTEGVPPTAHTLPLHNVWREDENAPSLDAPRYSRERPDARRRPLPRARDSGRMTARA